MELILILLLPAPDKSMNSICCNYTRGYGSNYTCRKLGKQCSIICGFCRGHSNTNVALADIWTESLEVYDNANNDTDNYDVEEENEEEEKSEYKEKYN